MKSDDLKSPHAKMATDDVIGFLKLCLQLRSEKEGCERPEPGGDSRDEDEFSYHLLKSIGYARQLHHLVPMAEHLNTLGVARKQQGTIQTGVEEDYPQLAQYPVDGGTGL